MLLAIRALAISPVRVTTELWVVLILVAVLHHNSMAKLNRLPLLYVLICKNSQPLVTRLFDSKMWRGKSLCF